VFSSSVPGLWDQRQRLGIPFVTSGAFFGIGIAIDGSTLMVGAEGVSHGASGSGSAFVYTLDLTGAWALEAELASAAPATSGTFGQSVAIANDRIVVGDPHPEAAFLYERIASQGWSNGRTLTSRCDASSSDGFAADESVNTGVVWVGANTRPHRDARAVRRAAAGLGSRVYCRRRSGGARTKQGSPSGPRPAVPAR
jgi:hypothetical protein